MLGLANRMSLSLGSSNAGAAILATTRNFTTLSAAGSHHYTIPTKTLPAGSFTIECDFLTSNDSTNQYIADGTGSRFYIFLNSTSSLFESAAGTITVDSMNKFM